MRDGVITLEKMFFDDEVRSIDGIAPSETKVDKKQLKMAEDLIGAYTSDFEPERYQDTYRERLLAIVEQKRQGKTTKTPEPEATPAAPDLLAALTASLDVARKERRPRRRRRPAHRRAEGSGRLLAAQDGVGAPGHGGGPPRGDALRCNWVRVAYATLGWRRRRTSNVTPNTMTHAPAAASAPIPAAVQSKPTLWYAASLEPKPGARWNRSAELGSIGGRSFG